MSSSDNIPVKKVEAELVCILHIGPGAPTNDTVKAFDADKWLKVGITKSIRMSRFSSDSKYATICQSLPEHYGARDGYHSVCYKNFTAVKKGQNDNNPEELSCDPVQHGSVLRSDVKIQVVSTSGVFEPVCIFCDRERKRLKNGNTEPLGECETFEAVQAIKEAALILDDQPFSAKYGDLDFVAKEAKYHHSCRKLYLSRAERTKKSQTSEKSEQSEVRDAHHEAFCILEAYVDTFIIKQKRCEFVKSLHACYLGTLEESGISTSTYTVQSLCVKLQDKFGNDLVTSRATNKEGNVLHHKSINKSEAIKRAKQFASSYDYEVSQTALKLRRTILQLLQTAPDLPTPLTAEVLRKGQADTPDMLMHFFRVLCTGSETVGDSDSRTERYVRTASADAIFVTSRGRVKPGKHLTLGVGIKSIVGSKVVVDILSRFNHSIHYNTVEECETELATNITERQESIPDGLLKIPGLATGLAWDNYDENTETLSGSGTLHDTFGICYQNIPAVPSDLPISEAISGGHEKLPKGVRKKRSFSGRNMELSPYRKKPKISTFDFRIKSYDVPQNLKLVLHRDLLWMMSTTLCKKVPMWIGWNSRLTEDPLPQQKIGFMRNMCLPPTRLDVVKETMNVSQKVGEETGQPYTIVSYDLAVAKLALKLQAEEAPQYDNLFICFGAFHITLTYFSGIGFILSESGGPEILIETSVLAPGSLNGFLTGRHYNRCKRLHILLANSMHTLHFRSFIKHNGLLPIEFSENLKRLHDEPSPAAMQQFEESAVYVEMMQNYEEYTEATRSGLHGATAEYWVMYIDLVELYLLLSRAVRTNDLDLFIYALGEMCDIFHGTGHPNYARYMVLYLLKLLNIDLTHPGVRQILQAGAMSIRRTGKSFSRNAVDLTVEQTVNCTAASRLTGITAFTKSDDARQRYMVTHSARSDVVGNLFDMAGLKKKEDCTGELLNHQIKRDNADMAKICSYVEETFDPFNGNHADNNLYCLTTGKAASDEVRTDLLNCKKIGKKWCDEFKTQCFEDELRFERPIPRRKIKNFASDAIKVKLCTKDKKIKELQGSRDLFGRLLYLSVANDVDLKTVFAYPLTPVPLALAHIDGTKHSTDKSTLMKILEKKITTVQPPIVDASAVDAMFIIQSQVDLPTTYGDIAMAILKRVLRASSCVHFVCDTYGGGPSIKDTEHTARGASGTRTEYIISGSEQKRQKNFRAQLESPKFKRALLHFLAEEWMKQSNVEVLKDHRLYVGLEDHAWVYEVRGDAVFREEVPELICNHQEADTRLAWHLKYIATNQPGSNVVIRCDDTDILVIMLQHVLNVPVCVWLDVGHNSKNNRRYIDVSSIAKHIGPELCKAMPGFHAMTGCDYTSCFYKKGKVRPLAIMERKFIKTFATLGDSEQLDLTLVAEIEEFVCCVYGKPKLKSVDIARHDIFHEHYKPKHQAKPLEKIKGIDSSNFPPCKSVLLEKIKRGNLVAGLYKRSDSKDPNIWKPEENGWKLDGGKYAMKWYDGRQVPEEVCNHIDDQAMEDVETDPVYCPSSDEESDNDAE